MLDKKQMGEQIYKDLEDVLSSYDELMDGRYGESIHTQRTQKGEVTFKTSSPEKLVSTRLTSLRGQEKTIKIMLKYLKKGVVETSSKWTRDPSKLNEVLEQIKIEIHYLMSKKSSKK